jgi:hypothetical protein
MTTTKAKQSKILKQAREDMDGVQDSLSDTITAFETGKISIKEANTRANLAGKRTKQVERNLRQKTK